MISWCLWILRREAQLLVKDGTWELFENPREIDEAKALEQDQCYRLKIKKNTKALFFIDLPAMGWFTNLMYIQVPSFHLYPTLGVFKDFKLP
jgi:hypothetical protein